MCVVCYVARDEGTVAACLVVYGYLLRIRLTVCVRSVLRCGRRGYCGSMSCCVRVRC